MHSLIFEGSLLYLSHMFICLRYNGYVWILQTYFSNPKLSFALCLNSFKINFVTHDWDKTWFRSEATIRLLLKQK